jgi:hypothetical protein
MWQLLAACGAMLLAASAAQAASGGITYAVIGAADPNGKVPAVNAVPGAGTTNVDLPIPLRIIVHGGFYDVMIGTENFYFSGSCTIAYALTAKVGGVVKTISSGITNSYTCNKETVWAWYVGTPAIPNYPGAALLTATATFGTTSVKYVVPLIIQ